MDASTAGRATVNKAAGREHADHQPLDMNRFAAALSLDMGDGDRSCRQDSGSFRQILPLHSLDRAPFVEDQLWSAPIAPYIATRQVDRFAGSESKICPGREGDRTGSIREEPFVEHSLLLCHRDALRRDSNDADLQRKPLVDLDERGHRPKGELFPRQFGKFDLARRFYTGPESDEVSGRPWYSRI